MPLYRWCLCIVVLVMLIFSLVFQAPLVSVARAQNASAASTQSMIKPITYPRTRKGDDVDDYHGTKVVDPYRWLEDLDSPETAAWVEAQNKLTSSFLNEIPARAAINSRLTKLWNYERYGVPFKEGSNYFYSRNSGLQNQSVLYTVTSLEGQPKVLLDPNILSTDGTVALSGLAITQDGKRMAYGLSASGSDWQEWKVRDVDAAKIFLTTSSGSSSLEHLGHLTAQAFFTAATTNQKAMH